MAKIVIVNDFSAITGGRTRTEGEYSGEEFRDNVLMPRYKESLEKNEILEIDFDGCYGIGTSFLEEAFGGLVRQYGYKDVWNNIKLVSNDDDTIKENVRNYIKAAEEKMGYKKRKK